MNDSSLSFAASALRTVVAGVYPVIAPALGTSPVPSALYIVIVVLLGIASLILNQRAERGRSLRDLMNAAYRLAADLRELLERNPQLQYGFGPTETEVQWARKERDAMIVQHYKDRFEPRARPLIGQFHRFGAVETDVFFRHVEKGSANDHNVFQIVAGLERLARQLPDR